MVSVRLNQLWTAQISKIVSSDMSTGKCLSLRGRMFRGRSSGTLFCVLTFSFCTTKLYFDPSFAACTDDSFDEMDQTNQKPAVQNYTDRQNDRLTLLRGVLEPLNKFLSLN